MGTALTKRKKKRWSAISRGAVMSAAKGLLTGDFAEITSRVARANYGFVHETKFEEGKHKEEDRYYNFVEGRDKAKNQTWWFLKKASPTRARAVIQHRTTPERF